MLCGRQNKKKDISMVTFLLYIHKDTRYLKVAPDTNKGRGK